MWGVNNSGQNPTYNEEGTSKEGTSKEGTSKESTEANSQTTASYSGKIVSHPPGAGTKTLPGSEVDPIQQAPEAFAKKIKADETSLYPYLIKTQGYYVLDSLPYTQYALPVPIREALISDDAKREFSTPIAWADRYRFKPVRELQYTRSLGDFMKKAMSGKGSKDPNQYGIALCNPQGSYNLPDTKWTPMTGPKPCSLELNPVNPDESDKTLAIYNQHEKRSIIVKADGRKIHQLKPKCGLILQPDSTSGSPLWGIAALYHSPKDTPVIETNPLLRDHPLELDTDGKQHQDSTTEGEYFLTAPMILDLAEAQSKGKIRPPLCQSVDDMQQILETFVHSTHGDKSKAMSVVIYDDHSNHFVAVRLLIQDNKLLVFINESLDRNNSAAQCLKDMVVKGIHKTKPTQQIILLTPDFKSQKDFSSCGVFTLKTFRAFEKNPNLDQWLWKQAKECNNTPDNKTQRLIPLKNMPAHLLKSYQGDKTKLSTEQLQTPIDKHGTTLEDYFKKHRPVNDSETGGKTNLATTGKRYKYLLQWMALRPTSLCTAMETDVLTVASDEPMVVDDIPASPSTPDSIETPIVDTPDEDGLIKKFEFIIDTPSLAEANEWLQVHHPGTQITEEDWCACVVFENFVFKNTLSKTENVQLEAWLNQVLQGNPHNIHNQLLTAWCYYMRKDKRSHYRRESLPLILDKLNEQIKVETTNDLSISPDREKAPLLVSLPLPNNRKRKHTLASSSMKALFTDTIPAPPIQHSEKESEDICEPKRTRLRVSTKNKRRNPAQHKSNVEREQDRRSIEKTAFEDLERELPSEEYKRSKQQILTDAIQYIDELKDTESSYKAEQEKGIALLTTLNQKLRKYEQLQSYQQIKDTPLEELRRAAFDIISIEIEKGNSGRQ